MASTTFHTGPAATVHGGTALGASSSGSRHRVGSAVRAVRVFVVTAVEIVVLGGDGLRRA
jgi:hypothetical protein